MLRILHVHAMYGRVSVPAILVLVLALHPAEPHCLVGLGCRTRLATCRAKSWWRN